MVTYVSSLPTLNSDKTTSYIATDNFKGGQIAAEHIGKMPNAMRAGQRRGPRTQGGVCVAF